MLKGMADSRESGSLSVLYNINHNDVYCCLANSAIAEKCWKTSVILLFRHNSTYYYLFISMYFLVYLQQIRPPANSIEY